VQLESLAKNYVSVMATIKRLSRRIDPEVLEKLIYVQSLNKDDLRKEETMKNWCQEVEARLNVGQAVGTRFEIMAEEGSTDSDTHNIKVIKRTHGIVIEQIIQSEFFDSAEYTCMVELGKQLDGLINDGAYVQRGDRKQEINSFRQAMDWLMEESKRGQNIQRYKGLGEMNPEQLYETTLNSDSRRLLQVQIEDVVASDQVFTTLMGDQVEPRRDFIEQNALSVANLDV
jgi:DNA gyrase subunit B